LVTTRELSERKDAPRPASLSASKKMKEVETLDYEAMWQALKESLTKRSQNLGARL